MPCDECGKWLKGCVCNRPEEKSNSKMKTSELTGKDLDHWVAKARGWKLRFDEDECGFTLGSESWYSNDQCICLKEKYSPTTNDAQAFELMVKFKIFPNYCNYRSQYSGCYYSHGSPRYIYAADLRTALCRAVVASEFGDEVSE